MTVLRKGALFLCVGVVFFYMMALRPLGQVMDAADWVQTPCTVEAIRLSEGTGDDGDNHEIDVAYRYEADGQTHRGDRYAFFMVASNVDGWMRREVAALATEPRTVCYVNPDNPAESVLRNGLTPSAWWALFPLPFIVIGAGGIIFALRQRGKNRRPVSSTLTTGPSVAAAPLTAPQEWLPEFRGPGDAMKLRSASTPARRALALLAVTLFWNGIVSIFVVSIIDEALDKGEIPWFPAAFISLFVVVGLVMRPIV